MISSLSWLSQSCISLLSSGSKFGLVRRKYWTAPLPPCSFLEVKPYLRGSDCEISWDVTAKCSGLCVPIAPGQHFLHTGTACSSSATLSIHKKPPGTRHRHLKTQLRGQQELTFHCQTLLYWGREFLLLLAWNNKFVFVLPKTQPRSCPRWALWVSVLQTRPGAHRGAERIPETLTLYSWGGFCNLNVLTQVNVWCKHLTFLYPPATRMRTSDHAFKHFADKKMLCFKKHLSQSQPAIKNLFL